MSNLPGGTTMTRTSRRTGKPDIDAAQALVTAVRGGDQVAVQRILGRADLPRIAVVLAERVPVPTHPRLAPCGTRSAAERHIKNDEPLDDACFHARRAYYREQYHRQRRPKLLRADRPSATSGRRSTSTTSSPTTSTTDVDPIVVERLIDGQPPLHVTRAERAEAVRLLDQRGKTRSEIAVQLHMSGGRVAQILDSFVRPAKHTPTTDNDRQEASA